MRVLLYGGFVLAAALMFPVAVYAEGVVLSEVAWMGMAPKAGESTQAAANNEWIELYNTSAANISLNGWKLTITDAGTSEIALRGTIQANGYFLLERGSDKIVPGVKADIIYPFKNGPLSNTGEHLIVKDNNGGVVDQIDARSGWPAGDNTTKQTMQLLQGTWITAPATPRMGIASLSLTPQPTPIPSPAQHSPTLKPSMVSVVIASQHPPIPNQSAATGVVPKETGVITPFSTPVPDIAAAVVTQQSVQSGWYGWFFALLGSFVAACIFFMVRRYASHG